MAGKDPNYPLRPDYVNVDGPMKENIAKLGKLITDRIPIKLGLAKVTKDDPEYWAVRILCYDDDDIAKFVIHIILQKVEYLLFFSNFTFK